MLPFLAALAAAAPMIAKVGAGAAKIGAGVAKGAQVAMPFMQGLKGLMGGGGQQQPQFGQQIPFNAGGGGQIAGLNSASQQMPPQVMRPQMDPYMLQQLMQQRMQTRGF